MIDSANILEQCREAGLRKTRALVDVIEYFCRSADPVTLSDLAQDSMLAGNYNDTTLYRLVTRLVDHGLVQRLGMHSRAAYYVLRSESTHRDYLVCTDCGKIVTLQLECPVHAIEQEIARDHGFANLYHELEFFGTCTACTQAHGGE